MMSEKSIDNYGNFLKDMTVKALADYFGGDYWDGSKFFGSLGPVSQWTFVDYWRLRRRSMQLFRTNIYAKGVIRRLVWNEIHTGIVATPTPTGAVLFPNKRLLSGASGLQLSLTFTQTHPSYSTGERKRLSELFRSVCASSRLFRATA